MTGPRNPVAAFRNLPARHQALAVTALIAAVGVLNIAALLTSPTGLEAKTAFWPVVDKRWIIASFLLAVALVYAPAALTRLFAQWKGEAPPVPAPPLPRQRTGRIALRLAVALTIGFAMAAFDVGRFAHLTLDRPLEPHEEVHFGALQRIAQGAVPYVEARTQYGPGHQALTYWMMRKLDFSVGGFRASFVLLNFLVQGLGFAIAIFAFGLWIGLGTCVLWLIFLPPGLMTFSGWFALMRWFAPFVVGAVLPLIAWNGGSRRSHIAATAALGIATGTLAWISQENFSTALITAGLILGTAFALGRVSLGRAMSLFAAFAISHVLTFVALLAATTGISNLPEALRQCFRLSALWARGLASTSWGSDDSTWTAAFYATPYVVIGLTALTLYAARPQPAQERWRGALVGLLAAAAAMVPITLIRSDEPHFLGPAVALPALIVLAIVALPGLLAARFWPRQAIRGVLLAGLAAIYLAPQGSAIIDRIKPRYRPFQGWAAIHAVLTRPETGSTFERRLGLLVKPEQRCCILYPPGDYADLRKRIEEIRNVVGTRSTFVHPNMVNMSMIYFLADLTVATSMPDTLITIYTWDDVDELKRQLTASPPQCAVISRSVKSGVTPMPFWQPLTDHVLKLYADPTIHPVTDAVIYCRK